MRVGVQSRAVRRYKDNDLVLLSLLPRASDAAAADAADDEDGDGASEAHALALVEQAEGTQMLRLRLHLAPPPAGTTRRGLVGAAQTAALARFAAVRAALRATGDASRCWGLQRLCNLSTIQREWLGVHAARSLPFRDVILSAQPRPSAPRHWRCPAALDGALAARFNPSQLQAIQAGLETAPIVLIQGPPGTGKTATLQALLSLVMHAVPASLGGGSHRGAAAPTRSAAPTPAERAAAWRAASPWLFGGANARDAGPPPPDADGASIAPALPPPPLPATLLGSAATRNPHVLVCAPSNSALDEIVLRLLQDGVLDSGGATYTPSLVRVGVHPHASVRAVTMDALVDARITATQRGQRAAALAPVAGDMAGVRAPAQPLRAGGADLALDAAAAPPAGDDGDESDSDGAPPRRQRIGTPLERDRARLAILDEASIVASTLSFSGSGLFTRMRRQFDVVVIDEAAQAVEPSVLVPLAYGCRQLFLVGDPIQLPATVLSDAAKDRGYDTSLFKRLQGAGHAVHVLRTQYRMHPEIRAFPSREFYAEALEDGPGVAVATARAWHSHPALGPFTFWDVRGEETRPSAAGEAAASWTNEAEARLVLALARAFLAAAPGLAARHDGLAVVSPYRGQVGLIRSLFAAELGEELARRIDVNTIDGFQGREREVVLFSVVRSPKPSKRDAKKPDAAPRIGFVADERRMNVGLTRARAALVVIGNASALRGDPHWGSLVEDAGARGRIVQALTGPGAATFDAQIAALGELPAGAPLQAPADDEDEEEWAPQAEERAAPEGEDADVYSDGEGGWAYTDGRDGGGDGGDGGEPEAPDEDAAAKAAAAARAKRPRGVEAPAPAQAKAPAKRSRAR